VALVDKNSVGDQRRLKDQLDSVSATDFAAPQQTRSAIGLLI
jgi:hypothetical protein